MDVYRATFIRQFDVPLGSEGHRTIYPVGWTGPVSDVVAVAAFRAAAATIDPAIPQALLDAAEAQTMPAMPGPVEIPAGWTEYSAADLVDLAKRLGAGDDVKTKAAATEFVAKVVEERARSPLI